MRFWLIYLLTVLVASAAIYEGVPILLAHAVTPVATPTPADALSTAARPAPPPASPAPEVAPEAGETLVVPLGVAAPPSLPAVTVAPAAPAQKPTTTTAAITGSPAAATSTPWGVTVTRVSHYTLTGENRGWLPGGVIVDIQRQCKSSRGDMAVCLIEQDGATAGPELIALSDLAQFDLPRAEAPPESVALLKQYYGLKGQLDQRLADLKQQAAGANPYAAAYRDAIQTYNAFVAREKALTRQRDQASGADRMRLADDLRAAIPQGARLQRELDSAKASYTGWKNTHAAPVALDPAADEQVRQLKQQLAPLEPRIKDMVK